MKCGFCGKAAHEVFRLIAGQSSHICSECICSAADLIVKDLQRESERIKRSSGLSDLVKDDHGEDAKRSDEHETKSDRVDQLMVDHIESSKPISLTGNVAAALRSPLPNGAVVTTVNFDPGTSMF